MHFINSGTQKPVQRQFSRRRQHAVRRLCSQVNEYANTRAQVKSRKVKENYPSPINTFIASVNALVVTIHNPMVNNIRVSAYRSVQLDFVKWYRQITCGITWFGIGKCVQFELRLIRQLSM